jgi:predicted dehydrogenase
MEKPRDVLTVEFHEYLDTSHGASFFRRWHNLKENSGTLLCTKSSHRFDLVNWWLASDRWTSRLTAS